MWDLPSLSTSNSSRPSRNLPVRSPGPISAEGDRKVQSSPVSPRSVSRNLRPAPASPRHASGRLSSTSLPSLSLRLAAPPTTSRRFTPESLVAPTTLPAGDSENRTALMTTSWPASRGPSAFGSVTSPFFAVTLASLWAFSGLRDTVVTVWPRDTASLVRRVPILPVPPTIAIFMSLLSSSVNGFVRQDEVGAAFADHDGGRVGVAADDIRHDRGVRNSQARDATHLEPRIEHRHLVAVRSHLAG